LTAGPRRGKKGAVNLLVIEDEARIASFIKVGLESEGFAVDRAATGRDALDRLTTGTYDLVVLDLILPDMAGEEVLRRIRATRPRLPVIVLTAKDAIVDRVANLNAGADDYVTKPFSFSELLARIRARLRAAEQSESSVLSHGAIRLDLERREARVGETPVDLTARALALLETFMRHPDQVLSQVQLLDRVWGYDYDPGSNVVEVYVGYLRKKLGPDIIETRRGVGYRFRG
jgi:DNA-binding response OmpR family regulator